MKLSQRLISLVLACVPTMAGAAILAYDTAYDNRNGSLATVSCSDGKYGFLTRGYPTFGTLDNFPLIGGAYAVDKYDSPNCGSCWQLTWTSGTGAKRVINLLAIDTTRPGFTTSFTAMNELTNGQALHAGQVDVVEKQVNPKLCGL